MAINKMLRKIINKLVSIIICVIFVSTMVPHQTNAQNILTHQYQIYNNPDKLYINKYFKGTGLNVPLIIQTHKYPTGCESVSAVEALNEYFTNCYKCSLRVTSEPKLTTDRIENLIDNSTHIIWVTTDLKQSSKGKQWTLIGSNKTYTYKKMNIVW